jgi:NAD(P)-dependent dehydrogenase (short-subunit alcohol dehydrogenase family)
MGFPEELIKTLEEVSIRASPIGIYGKPEHIANAVAFLASEDSEFMTGSNVVIDGGAVWSNMDIKLD